MNKWWLTGKGLSCYRKHGSRVTGGRPRLLATGSRNQRHLSGPSQLAASPPVQDRPPLIPAHRAVSMWGPVPSPSQVVLLWPTFVSHGQRIFVLQPHYIYIKKTKVPNLSHLPKSLQENKFCFKTKYTGFSVGPVGFSYSRSTSLLVWVFAPEEVKSFTKICGEAGTCQLVSETRSQQR